MGADSRKDFIRGTTKKLRFPTTLLLAAVLALCGCASPAYHWQATSGHLSLMRQRQSVEEILADPDTHEELRKQLELAGTLLDFAQKELALPAGENYRSLVEVGGPATWNVIATPEFSLQPKQWCFLVAGCVAYRGYFDREKALTFAEKMEHQGLDVAVLPAAAYSTLGWFDDPLLDTMLDQAPRRLAGTLFHELAHQRLYVRDDTVFNEAYASFVESAGVERWLSLKVGADDLLETWRDEQTAGLEFNELVDEIRQELVTLYGSRHPEATKRSEKAAILERLRQRYLDLVRESWDGREYFSGWIQADLNNAHLVAIGAYTGGRCAFDRLLMTAGGHFTVFHELAEEIAQGSTEQRRAWLDQRCTAVASGLEL